MENIYMGAREGGRGGGETMMMLAAVDVELCECGSRIDDGKADGRGGQIHERAADSERTSETDDGRVKE